MLLVSTSTVKSQSHYDRTCILKAGTHEFIKKDSFIDYGKARIETVQTLLDGVSQGMFIQKKPIDNNQFQKIVTGLFSSQHTKKKFKQFLAKHFGKSDY